MPGTSPIVADRMCSGDSGTTIVPMPWCVKSSISSAPSTWRLMRCTRFTPYEHAFIAHGR